MWGSEFSPNVLRIAKTINICDYNRSAFWCNLADDYSFNHATSIIGDLTSLENVAVHNQTKPQQRVADGDLDIQKPADTDLEAWPTELGIAHLEAWVASF